MADKSRPVWVWLPGEVTPVECGRFDWSPGLGKFAYSDAYKSRAGAVSIDPINLYFSRSPRPFMTTNLNGVFGVLRDAAPEGFGLDLLLAKHGMEALDEVERMDLAPGDGVGALEVCPSELIDRKVAFMPPSEAELISGLEKEDPGYSARRMVQRLFGAEDTTTLGGEKPKLTVSRTVGDLTEWWIAKLQDRGSAPFLPAREFVAMTLAAKCDIDVAEVRYQRVGPHEVLLVKRFDREVIDGGVKRSLFASAATALRLRSEATREDPDRSYVKLAYELKRWCGDKHQSSADQQRELWRRMAFNALVGNYDDHPRNHGLLHRNGSWQLAPAYDVVAIPRRREDQAMAVNRQGSRIATPEALVMDAELFSYSPREAWETLQGMAQAVHFQWRDLFIQGCGLGDELVEAQRPAFDLSEKIATGVVGVEPSKFERRRKRAAAVAAEVASPAASTDSIKPN